LTYHNVAHTRDGVVPAAERLGVALGLGAEERLLVCTAAWYHDIGFVVQRQDHEVAGVRIAAQVLPRWGYSAAQISQIAGMIMATKLPQCPQTLLEQVLADADLDSLGRADFFETNAALRRELAAAGSAATDLEWYGAQVQFLEAHRYCTAPAQRLRDACKARNLAALKRLLAQVPQAR
jgi:uncharacterized protein